MKTLLKIIGCLLAITTTSALAQDEDIICNGIDPSGNPVHVFLDFKARTFHLNKEIHPLRTSSQWPNGYVTENYTAEKGVVVYNAIGTENNHTTLYQMNALNNAVITTVPLSCREEAE